MLLVKKFGGTSVADPQRIAGAASIIKNSVDKGDRVIAVVSAMAGETDRLLALANSVSKNIPERETDVVVSTGEQVTAGLLAMALKELGVCAVSLLSYQVPIITDGIFGRSRIDAVATDRISGYLETGNVVVVPGFQGISRKGEITTIGRGGSDTSAVAIASAVRADMCEIYSDVDGVYTADPRMCPEAEKIERISYDEMLEIAGSGAKVVQMRAVELAAKYNLPLHIRSSLSAVEGTIVSRNDNDCIREDTLVSAVTHTLNEAIISIRRVPDYTSMAAQVFEPLAKSNINVDMIVQSIGGDNYSDISFTVEKNDLKKALAISERAASKIGSGKVEAAGDVSKISIIGIGMRSHAGVAAKMFDTLSKAEIPIYLISTSEIKVSVVVDMKKTERAVNFLHESFGLNR